MSGIFLSNYPVLSNVAVLANSGGIVSGGTTTIANGTYGSSLPQSITGTIIASGSPSGQATDVAVVNAINQLTTLVSDINTYRASLPPSTLSPSYGPGILEFYPNTNYRLVGSVTFSTTTINLNAQGNPNAQFFITTNGSFTFDNIPSITLYNGATNCNVFWLAGNNISFGRTSPTSIPGIFIAGTTISFANPSQVLGRLYSQGSSITFSGTSSVNAVCGVSNISGGSGGSGNFPISGICFPGNTPINTDQGIIAIEHINPDIHTINDKKIVAITKTITQDKHLVCFEKDSLFNNYPNKKTVMSCPHKIYYKGKMIEASKFITHFENVYKIEYSGEILYNVLMEKYTSIIVNNLICETLDPKNMIAKLYTSNFSEKYKNNIVTIMNNSILKKDYPTYKKIISRI